MHIIQLLLIIRQFIAGQTANQRIGGGRQSQGARLILLQIDKKLFHGQQPVKNERGPTSQLRGKVATQGKRVVERHGQNLPVAGLHLYAIINIFRHRHICTMAELYSLGAAGGTGGKENQRAILRLRQSRLW